MPVIPVTKLPDHIRDTIAAIKAGVDKANLAGVAAELPDEVAFQVTVLTERGAGAIERTSKTLESVDVVEQTSEETVQETDNEEGKTNSGGNKSTTDYTYESDA